MGPVSRLYIWVYICASSESYPSPYPSLSQLLSATSSLLFHTFNQLLRLLKMSTATPMNALLTSFMKFDGTNWFKYKHSVKMLLLRERSWDPVAVADGTSSVSPPAAADAKAHAEWVSKDELAYSTLFFTIDSSIHYLIQDVQTGSAAWTLLKKEYESNIRSRRYDIRQRFNVTPLQPSYTTPSLFSSTYSTHFHSFRKHLREHYHFPHIRDTHLWYQQLIFPLSRCCTLGESNMFSSFLW